VVFLHVELYKPRGGRSS